VDALAHGPRHRCPAKPRKARGETDLGPPAALALAHALGDVPGERVRPHRAAQRGLADGLLDRFVEARHVRAALVGTEVDRAIDDHRVGLLGAGRAEAYDALDTGHADAREAEPGLRARGLDVVGGAHGGEGKVGHVRS
jgi:hypothetical protein